MKIIFWGVRGSIASPGPKTEQYGGNTSCVEIVTSHKGNRRSLFLDAGSGLRERSPAGHRFDIFLSHFHWDHICGLPFFSPLYKKSNSVHLYGPEGLKRSLKQIFTSFFSEEFFPVPLSKIPAKLHFYSLDSTPIALPPFIIQPFRINHPGHTLGYLVTVGAKKIAYLCDHEPMEYYQHIRSFSPASYERHLLRHLRTTDILIHDAHFTEKQYQNYVGWGHSPWSYSLQLARKAHIRQLVLFHHSPENRDETLQKSFEHFRKGLKKGDPKVSLAKEGESLKL